MSKGSKVKLLRVPKHLLDEVDAEIARRNRGKRKNLLLFSEWARQAFREKLDHARRGKKSKPAAKPAGGDDATCKHGHTFFEGCSACDKEYDGLSLQTMTLLIDPDASQATEVVNAHEKDQP